MGLTAPKEKPSKYDNMEEAIAEEEKQENGHGSLAAAEDKRPVLNLRGTLLSVECGQGAGAELMLSSGGNRWKMRVDDRARLLLIGTENFDCGWQQRAVSLNYKLRKEHEGDVVSLELH
jgi:hypothetical protein